MTFRIEVAIPIEIEITSAWVANYNKLANSKRRLMHLDHIDEVREKAHIKMVAYIHYVNAKV